MKPAAAGAMLVACRLAGLSALGASLFRRLPVPRHPLRLRDLVGGHKPSQGVAQFGGISMTLRCRQAQPHMGKNIVWRHGYATLVHDAQGGLRYGLALFGRLTEPTQRLSGVLRYAYAILVYAAEGCLRHGIALLGKRPTEPKSLRVVLPAISRRAVF